MINTGRLEDQRRKLVGRVERKAVGIEEIKAVAAGPAFFCSAAPTILQRSRRKRGKK
jgi:hypothetical protein